jgi:hypothetical protein
MGARGRAGSSVSHKKVLAELRANSKLFSRARAERALRNGADPNEERFTAHKNKHVKAIAARLIAKLQPTDDVCEVVHSEEVVEPQE